MDGKRNIKLWTMCLHIPRIIFLCTMYWLWRRWKKEDIMFLRNGKIKIIEEGQQKSTIILKRKLSEVQFTKSIILNI